MQCSSRMMSLLLAAAMFFSLVPRAQSCTLARGYFHQITRLRGKVVGADLGMFQWRWLRQAFTQNKSTLTLYNYSPTLMPRSEMQIVRTARTDRQGTFDFGPLPVGHYTLVIEDSPGHKADWFYVQVVTDLPKETTAVTIDVSPVFPDCSGGHEFQVNSK